MRPRIRYGPTGLSLIPNLIRRAGIMTVPWLMQANAIAWLGEAQNWTICIN